MKTIQEKLQEQYPVKSGQLGMMVKDVDLTKRIVAGYYNAFNHFDSDHDVIVQGAFAKSISERGVNSASVAKIKHALFHDLTKLPGKIVVLNEDEKGLYFETKMSNTTLGNDTLINYQEKIYDNHSIGFRYLDVESIDKNSAKWGQYIAMLSNPAEAEANGYMHIIKEVKLWEGSTVAFGANQLTPYLGSKSMTKEAIQIKLFERMDLLEKQIRGGTQSDEMLSDLEIQVRQLKQMLNELLTFEPETKPTPPEPGKSDIQIVDVNKIVGNLKIKL